MRLPSNLISNAAKFAARRPQTPSSAAQPSRSAGTILSNAASGSAPFGAATAMSARMLAKRSYHKGPTPEPVASILRRHPVAEKLLKHATFQGPDTCHSDHQTLAMKAAGPGARLYGPLSDDVAALRVKNEGPFREISVTGALPSAEDMEDLIEKRGLAVLNGAGIAALDSAYHDENPSYSMPFSDPMSFLDTGPIMRSDHHAKIVFEVGTLEKIAEKTGGDLPTLQSQFPNADPGDKYVVTLDLDETRNLPVIENLKQERGLENDDLQQLSPEDLRDSGAAESMLAITPYADLQAAFSAYRSPAMENPIEILDEKGVARLKSKD